MGVEQWEGEATVPLDGHSCLTVVSDPPDPPVSSCLRRLTAAPHLSKATGRPTALSFHIPCTVSIRLDHFGASNHPAGVEQTKT